MNDMEMKKERNMRTLEHSSLIKGTDKKGTLNRDIQKTNKKGVES